MLELDGRIFEKKTFLLYLLFHHEKLQSDLLESQKNERGEKSKTTIEGSESKTVRTRERERRKNMKLKN